MAILSLSSSIEAVLGILFFFFLLFLFARWDYHRLCREIAPPVEDEPEYKDWRWPSERHAGPASRSDRLPYGRKQP